MDNFLYEITNYLSLGSEASWVMHVFIVVLLTLVVGFIANRALGKLHIKFRSTKNLWDDAVVSALKRPVKFMIWIIGITFALEIVYKEAEAHILSAIYPIRDISIIAVICWFVVRFINNIEHSIMKSSSADKTTVDAVGKILRAAVVITASLITLQTLGFSISGVLAFGGVGGIAIGFAAKDLLANFFGAMMIYLDRPFQVGDWIRSPDKEIEGTVEHIGWRQTRIRTFDKRPLYVPNSIFSTIAVENPSRMTNRRIYETIGVRYDDVGKLDKIIKDVKKMLADHKEINENLTMIVNVDAFAPSSVDFFVYTFTHTTDWIHFHEIKQDVMLKISEIIEKNKAQIAFPTSTIHIQDGIKAK